MGCNLHRTIVRWMGVIICKSAGWVWGAFSGGWGKMGRGELAGRREGLALAGAFSGTDPRWGASSCQLSSEVSPVPKGEGPGAPSVRFLGVESRAAGLKIARMHNMCIQLDRVAELHERNQYAESR